MRSASCWSNLQRLTREYNHVNLVISDGWWAWGIPLSTYSILSTNFSMSFGVYPSNCKSSNVCWVKLLPLFRSKRKCCAIMNNDDLPHGACRAAWHDSAYVWNFIPNSPLRWRESMRNDPKWASNQGKRPRAMNSEMSRPSSNAVISQSIMTSRPVWSTDKTLVRKVLFHARNSDADEGKFSILMSDKSFDL